MAAGSGLLTKNTAPNPGQDSNFQGLKLTTGSGGVDPNSALIRSTQDQANAPLNQYLGQQQHGPYRGGMQTSFNTNSPVDSAAGFDSDSDVRNAYLTQNEIEHPTSGTDSSALVALNNMYQGRIGQKNSLAAQIAGSDSQLAQAQDLNKATAGSALGEGLKNTRQNFNDRGLLYSGARQGGEAAVKAQGASNLASSMAGTARDAANSKTAAQNAYASVDLANQQDSLNRATQAYDTASANNIARLQAMQQLAGGLGAAAGSIAGSYSSNQPVQPDGSAGGYGSFYNGNGLIGSSSAGNGPAYNQTRAQPSWE